MSNAHIGHFRPLWVLGACAFILLAAAPAIPTENRFQFLDPLNGAPLDITPTPQDASEAVAEFHQTGQNPYAGDQQAVTEGQKLYKKWCQTCHMPDGSGRIGPNLVDDHWKYERTATDAGKFEIIYAGGAGAMQSFRPRMSQDEMLQLIAFLDSLRAAHRSD
jgi:cytochrome c-L